MKKCTEYETLIELLPSMNCFDPRFNKLLGHLQECPECWEKYLVSQKIDTCVKEGMQKVDMPLLLEERVKARYKQGRFVRHDVNAGWRYVMPTFLVALAGLYLYLFLARPDPARELEKLAAGFAQQHKTALSMARRNQLQPINFNVERVSLAPDSLEKTAELEMLSPEQWNKVELGDVRANYVFLKGDKEKATLYLITDDLADLKQWDGKKQTFTEGKYSVAIWKKGNTIYSMVLKYPKAEKESSLDKDLE